MRTEMLVVTRPQAQPTKAIHEDSDRSFSRRLTSLLFFADRDDPRIGSRRLSATTMPRSQGVRTTGAALQECAICEARAPDHTRPPGELLQDASGIMRKAET